EWEAPGGEEPTAGPTAPAVNPATDIAEINILFLAANPRDITRLRVDEECRKIEKALERSKYREKIHLISKGAVQIPDLRRALMDHSPNILHFSGHGSELGRIYLEDASGNGREVPVEALANLLRLFKEQLKCVVLNACYSEIQADEIVKYGIPVIGMTTKVPDKAGIEFSEAFYDALGAGKDLDFAFELGCSAISMADLPGAEAIPVLKKPA
ncbi:CHAT domain-containing protein, partial [Arthrospira platensis SPKY1]|nr:CHAT domain-containing protein [Arthrospira platensis SPKY1]